MAEPVFLEPEDAPAVMTPDKSEAPRAFACFRDRVVSEKPLDEVVLDYLVEKARKEAVGQVASRAPRIPVRCRRLGRPPAAFCATPTRSSSDVHPPKPFERARLETQGDQSGR